MRQFKAKVYGDPIILTLFRGPDMRDSMFLVLVLRSLYHTMWPSTAKTSGRASCFCQAIWCQCPPDLKLLLQERPLAALQGTLRLYSNFMGATS